MLGNATQTIRTFHVQLGDDGGHKETANRLCVYNGFLLSFTDTHNINRKAANVKHSSGTSNQQRPNGPKLHVVHQKKTKSPSYFFASCRTKSNDDGRSSAGAVGVL